MVCGRAVSVQDGADELSCVLGWICDGHLGLGGRCELYGVLCGAVLRCGLDIVHTVCGRSV